MKITIKQYQQAADKKVSIGGIKWLDKWDVCIECDSREETETIRTRLSAPEPTGEWVGDKEFWEYPKQPEPSSQSAGADMEPVAWRFDQAKYRENDLRGRQWAFNVFSQTKPYLDEMVRDVTPLYTAPPQREWVGLTDEEIREGNKDSWVTRQAWESAAWWAEAKLKEKNT